MAAAGMCTEAVPSQLAEALNRLALLDELLHGLVTYVDEVELHPRDARLLCF